METTYELAKTTKGSKYLYEVKDSTGKVISKRTSARDYVACTINGQYYFGRIDLIGKGEHGTALKRGYDVPVAFVSNKKSIKNKYCYLAHYANGIEVRGTIVSEVLDVLDSSKKVCNVIFEDGQHCTENFDDLIVMDEVNPNPPQW